MRFKREVEFSVDEDGSLWLYLDTTEGISRPCAFNLSIREPQDGIIHRNLDSWIDENVKHYTRKKLEALVADPQIPESIRRQAEFHLRQVL